MRRRRGRLQVKGWVVFSLLVLVLAGAYMWHGWEQMYGTLCRSGGIWPIRMAIMDFTDQHRHLPTRQELEAQLTKDLMSGKQTLSHKCVKGPFIYLVEGEHSMTPRRAILMCPAAHGFLWGRFRNVVYSDGSTDRVPEPLLPQFLQFEAQRAHPSRRP